MKTFLLRNPKRILAMAGLASICGLFGTASAQGKHYEREYANYTESYNTLFANVTDKGKAVNGNLQEASTLDVTLGTLGLIESVQYVEFTTDTTSATKKTITAGTPVYVKFSSSAALVSALKNMEIGTFTNLHKPLLGGWTADRVVKYTDASLLSLINGQGTNEIEIIPDADCDGIYIRLSPTLSVASSTDFYHVYKLNEVDGDAGCPTNIDYLSGISSATGLDLASATSNITDEAMAFDNDDNTAAILNTGTNLLSAAYLTDILNTPGKAGDSVRIVFNNPDGGLLNLDLLSGFEIQAYNGNTAVGDPVAINSSLINLALLPGSTDKSIITAPIQGTNAGDFDRIKITYGGVAQTSSVLGNGSLAIYDMSVLVPAPQTGNVANSTIYAYTGNDVTLSATKNANGDDIVWYDNPDGTGSAVSNTQSGLSVGTHTFYARSSRDGCTSASANDTLVVRVASISHNDLAKAEVGSAYTGKLEISVATDPDLPNTPIYKLSNITGTFDDGTTINLSAIKGFNNLAMASIPAVYGSGPYANLNTGLFAAAPLDNGLEMDEDGNITGTPIQEGTLHISATVTDQANGLSAGTVNTDLIIGQALPVQLSNFDVNLDADKNAVVTWTTQSEQGSIRFDVLRSNDGINFTVIGSKDAAGISTKAIDYSFTDHNPGAKSYYKLNIVKNDGIKTSNMVSITGGRVAGFSINPNPASNDITITGLSDIKSVSIYDASGRLVQTATSNHINVRNLSQGIYFVTVVTNDGNKVNSKFIKK